MIKRLVLAAAATLTTMGLAEAGLRLVWTAHAVQRELNTRFILDDPQVGLVHGRNVAVRVPFPEHPSGRLELRTNNLGLRRDVDTTEKKPPGVFRVLVLGDSHTDGAVYNRESFSSLLEQSLNQTAARGIEVLNAGIGESHPLLELSWLEKYGSRLAPDLVILGVYVGNDIVDLLVLDKPSLCSPHPACGLLAGRPTKVDRAKQWLPRDLALYRLLAFGVRATPLAGWLQSIGLMSYRYQPAAERAAAVCRECVWQTFFQAYVAREHPSEMRVGLENTAAILDDFERVSRQLQAKFAVLVLPTRNQVEPEEDHARIDGVEQALRLTAKEANFDEDVRQTLVADATRRHLVVLDALGSLRSTYVTTRQPLFWRTDWHPNHHGNRVIAEALHEFVRSTSLVPGVHVTASRELDATRAVRRRVPRPVEPGGSRRVPSHARQRRARRNAISKA